MYNHLPILLILAAAVLGALSGVPALRVSRRSAAGQRIAAVLPCPPPDFFMQVAADAMSAFFLVPVIGIGALPVPAVFTRLFSR